MVNKTKYFDWAKKHPTKGRTLADSTLSKYWVLAQKFMRDYPEFFKMNLNLQEKEDIIRDFLFEYSKSGEINRTYQRKFALKPLLGILDDKESLKLVDGIGIKLSARRREGQHLTPGEIKDLVTQTYELLSLMIRIAFETAARIGSILKIEPTHLKKDSEGMHYLLMREKGNKAERKYLSPETAELLLKIMIGKKGRIFQVYDDIERNQYHWYLELKSESKRILKADFGISWHWIRRSRALYLRSMGYDLVSIQHLLGHSSLATTQKYIARESSEENKAIMKKDKFKW